MLCSKVHTNVQVVLKSYERLVMSVLPYFHISFCLHNLHILYKHSSKTALFFGIIDMSKIHYAVNIFPRMTNVLRGFCIMSALHFIDLILRERSLHNFLSTLMYQQRNQQLWSWCLLTSCVLQDSHVYVLK